MTRDFKAIRNALLWALLAGLAIAFWMRVRDSNQRQPDPASVVLQVRRLKDLSTVRYTVQKIVTLEEQKDPVGSERILLVLQARVEAGVNLSELQQRDVERRPDGTLVI